MRKRLLVALLLLPATAQVRAENIAHVPGDTIPLVVEVTPPAADTAHDVTEPIRFKLAFSRSQETDEPTVTVRQYYLTVDDQELLNTRTATDNGEWNGAPSEHASAGGVKPPQSVQFDVTDSPAFGELEIPSVGLRQAALSRGVLLFVAGQYAVTVHVDYYVGGKSTELQSCQHTFQVSLRPPFLALIIGGIAGCCLLCVFLGAYNIYKPPPGKTRSLGLVANTLVEGVLLFVVGSIATFILLLCILRPEYGIASTRITVHDFIGAFLVGLSINLYLDLLAARLRGGKEAPTVG